MAPALLRQQHISTLLSKHSPGTKTLAPRALYNHAIESRLFSTSYPRSVLRQRWYIKPRKGVHAEEKFKLAPRSNDAGTYPPVFEERKRALQLEPRLANKDYREEILRRDRKMDAFVKAGIEGTTAMTPNDYVEYLRLKRETLAAKALEPFMGGKVQYEHRVKVWKELEDSKADLVRRMQKHEEEAKRVEQRTESEVSKVENVFAIMAIIGAYGAGTYLFSG